MIPTSEIGTIIDIQERTCSQRPTGSASTIIGRHTIRRTTILPDEREHIHTTTIIIKKIRRVPSYISTDIAPSQHYVMMSNVAKTAGFRVPPSYAQNRQKVEVLDVSRGGKFFDKVLAAQLDPMCPEEEFTDDPANPIFQYFLTLDPSDVFAEVTAYIDRANYHNLLIPDDDSANLLILPSGEWEL